ncbi:class I adenylate-forming enzyme family protein [Brevundimonas sp. M20]|uniref:class I adenylate-forming enzyme family protein n=1 Tax=Brevundimonas sp. M20 TaxID=2591463 RepID=UPI0011464056|nr:AMP-binding protein [Brevundimonas sp. M20]QDH72344.1 long-chain fatty acid--CoA ligase [Brevundimonas sp. M20]
MTHPIRALYENAAAKADRAALYDGDVTLTHGALIALVERAAADLTARGIQPGDRIGLCAANSWRHVVAYLAILRANAVWTPLNPRNGAGLNGDFQRRAGLALTLHDAGSIGVLGATRRPLPLEAWLDSLPDVAPPAIFDDPAAPFALKFTGGSTGVPKGVIQSQASGAAALRSLRQFYGFTADDVNLAVAPLTHGAAHYVLPGLAAGGAHVLLATPDRAAILSELKHRVSVVFMPPTLIALLMGETDFGPDDFPRLRHLTWSAAPMSPGRVAQAVCRFGPVLSSLYGQTEAPMAITGLTAAETADPALRSSVGRPFPGTPVGLLTREGHVVPRGEGEVVVGGDLARTEYLDAPDLTAASRHEGWLKTGDIGRIDADGRLTLIGRSKELIITGGYNVYPGEVEAALNAHPAVREACAFGLPDDVWGERLEAAVAVDARFVDDDAIRAFVRDAIGPVRTPKRLHLMPALPRNPVGKVVRGEVRSLLYPDANTAEEARP